MEKLQNSISYDFKNEHLLQRALTHSSYVREHNMERSECNERLEFLGDAVLDTVIAERLFEIFEKEQEGKLSKLRAEIVQTASLAVVAKNIELGLYLKLGQGEKHEHGEEKPTVLENAMEAVIGAVFLDAGYDKSKEVVLKLFEKQIAEAIAGNLNNDYKSRLYEFVQKDGKKHEIKCVTDREIGKSHDKIFYMSIRVDGKMVGQGIGKSKKAAEQLAAKEALERLQGRNNVF